MFKVHVVWIVQFCHFDLRDFSMSFLKNQDKSYMYSEKKYSQQDSIKQISSKSPSVSPVGGMFVDCWFGNPSKKANITEGWTYNNKLCYSNCIVTFYAFIFKMRIIFNNIFHHHHEIVKIVFIIKFFTF